MKNSSGRVRVAKKKFGSGRVAGTRQSLVSGAGQIKRAKAVDSVLNHTSEHDKKAKADMVAKKLFNEATT